MAKAKTEKKKSNLLRNTLLILGITVIALLILAVILLANLFGKAPEFAVEPLQAQDFALQGKIAGKLINEIMREIPPEEASITLTPDEVRSLIRFADNGITVESMLSGRGGTRNIKNHNIRFEDGYFTILSPVQTEYRWLFGGVIMTEMNVRPKKEGELLELDITGFRAGAYRVPDSVTARVTAKILEDFKGKKDYRIFDSCVKSIRIEENNNLTLVYRPRVIAKEFMPENLQRQLQKLRGVRR